MIGFKDINALRKRMKGNNKLAVCIRCLLPEQTSIGSIECDWLIRAKALHHDNILTHTYFTFGSLYLFDCCRGGGEVNF